MQHENGLNVDMDAVNGVLRQADVLAIGFTTFTERLFIDFRSNATEGPLAAIVEPVASVQERYLWLGRHRGQFGTPEAFTFFMWPHTVRTLRARDVLAPARARLAAHSEEAAAALDRTLEDLSLLEREAFRGAIRGGDPAWQTLWERAA